MLYKLQQTRSQNIQEYNNENVENNQGHLKISACLQILGMLLIMSEVQIIIFRTQKSKKIIKSCYLCTNVHVSINNLNSKPNEHE